MDKRKSKIKYRLHTEDSLILRERYQTVLEETNVLIYDIDLERGNIYISNQLQCAATSAYKRNKQRLRQILNTIDIHPEDRYEYKQFLRQHQEKELSGVITYRRKNDEGNYSWIKNSRKNTYNKEGRLIRVIGTEQDVSSEMNAYIEINKSIELDSLTGIYNLSRFIISAVDKISTYKNRKFAIMVFDIDNFRVINDLHGTIEGDKILQHIGQVLSRTLYIPSLYCRMYSDNFAIFLEYENDDDIIKLANFLSHEICKYPIKLDGMLSFGVCKMEDCSTSIGKLCDYASLAKKKVKGNVVHLLAFYDETLRKKALDDQDIENEMADALKQHQFEMYLQPKVAIANSDVVGAEALVRWNHPVRGIITPDKFIPLFEKNGFIIKLDYYIWEKAFATIRKWLDEGYDPVPISVNVSRVHIYDSNIIEIFKNLAIKYRVPTYMIELELTETTYFDNFDMLSKIILDLKKEGFILSIDDFGSGYTSLNMLKDVPIDVIKFDKGFTKEILSTERGKTVIQYTIAMAKQLDIEVIAEGVEDFYQAQFLFEAGCEIAQGYFYSKPLPIHKFESYTFGYYYKMQIL